MLQRPNRYNCVRLLTAKNILCLFTAVIIFFVVLFNLVHFQKHQSLSCITEPSKTRKNTIDRELLLSMVRLFFDLPNNRDYQFSKNPPKLDGQIGVPPYVDKILGGKTNGFFVECGAYNGEIHSNSLYFELKRNYSGLLIEPGSEYSNLLKLNRKVTSLNVCLAIKSEPHKVDFYDYRQVGGIKGKVTGWAKDDVIRNAKTITAQCIPLSFILHAVGNPTIDYFSLDIEGVEAEVLRTIPWNEVDIKIFSIEVFGNGRDPKEVDDIMRDANYTLVCSARRLDKIFVRNDFRSSFFGGDGTPRLMEFP